VCAFHTWILRDALKSHDISINERFRYFSPQVPSRRGSATSKNSKNSISVGTSSVVSRIHTFVYSFARSGGQPRPPTVRQLFKPSNRMLWVFSTVLPAQGLFPKSWARSASWINYGSTTTVFPVRLAMKTFSPVPGTEARALYMPNHT